MQAGLWRPFVAKSTTAVEIGMAAAMVNKGCAVKGTRRRKNARPLHNLIAGPLPGINKAAAVLLIKMHWVFTHGKCVLKSDGGTL